MARWASTGSCLFFLAEALASLAWASSVSSASAASDLASDAGAFALEAGALALFAPGLGAWAWASSEQTAPSATAANAARATLRQSRVMLRSPFSPDYAKHPLEPKLRHFRGFWQFPARYPSPYST